MDKKLFEENGNVKRTLKYIYVPVIKNAFKFDNEKYDVIIKDLNFIPFYEEQKFDAEKRYKVAKILNMYNLAEYLGILPNEKIYPDLFYEEVNLSANVSTKDYIQSSYEYNEKLKNFIKWYNRQNIDFIVFNVGDTEQTIEYWRYSLEVELKDIFRDMPNDYLKTVSKIEPWLILKPNKDYSYLKVDSRDYICPDYDLCKDYYEINSMYIISYLLEEFKILEYDIILEENQIKVKINTNIIQDLLSESFHINNFYNEVIKSIKDFIEDSIYYGELEEYVDYILTIKNS